MAMFLANFSKLQKRSKVYKANKKAHTRPFRDFQETNDEDFDSDDEIFHGDEYEHEDVQDTATEEGTEYEFFEPSDDDFNSDYEEESESEEDTDTRTEPTEDDYSSETSSETETETSDSDTDSSEEDYTNHQMASTPPIKGNAPYNWPWL